MWPRLRMFSSGHILFILWALRIAFSTKPFLLISQLWITWTICIVLVWMKNPVKAGLLLWISRDFLSSHRTQAKMEKYLCHLLGGWEGDIFFWSTIFLESLGVTVLWRSLSPAPAWAPTLKSLVHQTWQCPLSCPVVHFGPPLCQPSCSCCGFQFPLFWGPADFLYSVAGPAMQLKGSLL